MLPSDLAIAGGQFRRREVAMKLVFAAQHSRRVTRDAVCSLADVPDHSADFPRFEGVPVPEVRAAGKCGCHTIAKQPGCPRDDPEILVRSEIQPRLAL